MIDAILMGLFLIGLYIFCDKIFGDNKLDKITPMFIIIGGIIGIICWFIKVLS